MRLEWQPVTSSSPQAVRFSVEDILTHLRGCSRSENQMLKLIHPILSSLFTWFWLRISSVASSFSRPAGILVMELAERWTRLYHYPQICIHIYPRGRPGYIMKTTQIDMYRYIPERSTRFSCFKPSRAIGKLVSLLWSKWISLETEKEYN